MKKIMVILISLLLLTGCGEKSEASDKGGENKNKEIITMKMNEDAFITDDTGEIRVKFLSVKESDNRNDFSDLDPDRVIIVEYEYENKSRERDVYVDDMSFKLYDKDNNVLESYPSTDVKDPVSISTGRKTTAQVGYALDNDENYIELEFYDDIFNTQADAKFILEW